VTGVQTCALPIWRARCRRFSAARRPRGVLAAHNVLGRRIFSV